MAPRLTLGLAGTLTFVAAALEAQTPPHQQIAQAVAAAPERMQADATVLGYKDGKLVTLRQGTGLLVCLADDPKEPGHHVSCYHKDLEPFMSRGRELRAQGLKAPAIESTRLAEIKSGKLKFPSQPTTLYQLISQKDDPAQARPMYVMYIPYATPESTGLSTRPLEHGPWLMYPGMPWSHVMIVP
jgi:hypothetical protein